MQICSNIISVKQQDGYSEHNQVFSQYVATIQVKTMQQENTCQFAIVLSEIEYDNLNM